MVSGFSWAGRFTSWRRLGLGFDSAGGGSTTRLVLPIRKLPGRCERPPIHLRRTVRVYDSAADNRKINDFHGKLIALGKGATELQTSGTIRSGRFDCSSSAPSDVLAGV